MQVWIPTPQGWYAGVRAGFAVDWELPHASNMGFAWCISQAAPQTSNVLVLCSMVQLQGWNSNELGFKLSFGSSFRESEAMANTPPGGSFKALLRMPCWMTLLHPLMSTRTA